MMNALTAVPARNSDEKKVTVWRSSKKRAGLGFFKPSCSGRRRRSAAFCAGA
jgi:hypothetical protein